MLINIDRKKFNYGALIGFKLSRLEWIWDSKYEEVKVHFASSKDEILSKLPENIIINDSSYANFSNSILDHFLKNDIDIHYAMLIGFCIQRGMLYGSSKVQKENDEILEFAKSSLNSIPSAIIPNKTKLLNFIIDNKNDDFWDLFNKIGCSENYEVNSFIQDLLERIRGTIKKLRDYIDSNYDDSSRYASVKQAKLSMDKLKKMLDDIYTIDDVKKIEIEYQQEYSKISNALGWN